MNYTILLSIVAFYFFIVLAITLVVRYKKTGSLLPTLGEFLLANRSLSSPVLSATFFATLFSAAGFIAHPELIFIHGISGVLFVVVGLLLALVFSALFYKKFRSFAVKHKVYSPIECLSISYQSKGLGVLVTLVMIALLLPYLALQLVGVGFFLEAFTQGQITYFYGVGLMVAVVAVYVVLGGMRTIAYTDAIQAVFMLIAFTGGAFFLANVHWGGVLEMLAHMQKTAPQHFTFEGPKGAFTPLYFATASLMFLGNFVRPDILTRSMMAKNNTQINIMLTTSIFVAVGLGVLVFFYGIMGYGLYGTTLGPNQFMGAMFAQMGGLNTLGMFLSGLFLVGLLGASMSTADSMLMATGQMLTRDVIAPYKAVSLKKQVIITRVIMAVAMAIAFFVGIHPPALIIDLALLAISASCALIPVYLGFTWSKRSTPVAMLAIILGLMALISTKFLGAPKFGMHEGFICLITSSITYWVGCQLWWHKVPTARKKAV